jgi:uncharacterized protein YggE
MEYSDVAEDAIQKATTATEKMTNLLKAAGATEFDILPDEKTKAYPVRTQPAPARFASAQLIAVEVHDLSTLSKLVEAINNTGNKSWSISYGPSDSSRIALSLSANQQALADATRKTEAFARDQGLTLVGGGTIKNYRDCFPTADDPNGNCLDSRDPPGPPEIILTARRLNKPRTEFSVPKPKEQTIKATVEAVFTLR